MATESKITLRVDDKATPDIKKVNESVNGLKSGLEGISSLGPKFTKVGNALTVGLTGPILSAKTALVGMITTTTLAADRIDKMSERTGISRQSLQELQYVAQQTGVDFRGLDGVFAGFAARLNTELIGGTSAAAEGFAALGVATEDAAGNMRSSGDIIEDTMVAIADIEDPAERSAAALTVFGAEGAKLLPMLNQGSEGIENLRQRANALGLVLEDETIAILVTLGDRLSDVRSAFSGLTNGIIQEFAPIIEEEVIPLITQELIPAIQDIAEKAADVIRWFASLSEEQRRLVTVSVGVVAALGPLLSIIGRLMSAANLASGALTSLSKAGLLSAGPVGWAVLAAGAITYLAVQLAGTNDKSMAGAARLAKERFDELKNKSGELKTQLDTVKDTLTSTTEALGDSQKASLLSSINSVADSLGQDDPIRQRLTELQEELSETGRLTVASYNELVALIALAEDPSRIRAQIRMAALDAEEAELRRQREELEALIPEPSPEPQTAPRFTTSSASARAAAYGGAETFNSRPEMSDIPAAATAALEANNAALERNAAERAEIQAEIVESDAAFLNRVWNPEVPGGTGGGGGGSDSPTPETKEAVDAAAKAWVKGLQDLIDIGSMTVEQAAQEIFPRFDQLWGQLLTLDPNSQEFKDAKAKWDVLFSALTDWDFDFDATGPAASVEEAFSYWDFLLEETKRPQSTREEIEEAREEAEALRDSLDSFSVGEEYRAFLEDEALRPQSTAEEIEEAREAAEKLKASFDTFAMGQEYEAFLRDESLRPQSTREEIEAAREEAEALSSSLDTFAMGEEYLAFLTDEALRPQSTREEIEAARLEAEALSKSLSTFEIGEEYIEFLNGEIAREEVTEEARERIDAINELKEAYEEANAANSEFFNISSSSLSGTELINATVQNKRNELAEIDRTLRALIDSGFQDSQFFTEILEDRNRVLKELAVIDIELSISNAEEAIRYAKFMRDFEMDLAYALNNNEPIGIVEKAQTDVSVLTTELNILQSALVAAADAGRETGDWNAWNIVRDRITEVNVELDRHKALLAAADRVGEYSDRRREELSGYTEQMYEVNDELNNYRDAILYLQSLGSLTSEQEQELYLLSAAAKNAEQEIEKLGRAEKLKDLTEQLDAINDIVKVGTDALAELVGSFEGMEEAAEIISFAGNQLSELINIVKAAKIAQEAYTAAVVAGGTAMKLATMDIIGLVIQAVAWLVQLFSFFGRRAREAREAEREAADERREIFREFFDLLREANELGMNPIPILMEFDITETDPEKLRESLEEIRQYVEEVKGYFEGLRGAINSSMSAAFRELANSTKVKSDALEDFRRSFKQGVYEAVLDGIIEAVIQAAIMEAVLQPFLVQIAEAIQAGDYEKVGEIFEDMGPAVDDALESLQPVMDMVYDFGQRWREAMAAPDVKQYESVLEKTQRNAENWGQFVSQAVSIPLFDAAWAFEKSVDRFGRYIETLVDQGIQVHATSTVTVNNTGIPAYN